MGYYAFIEKFSDYDVNKRDDENVTLLHWSAINNRQEIAKFLIDRGAVIDAIGGELISTPIHWATRQGKTTNIISDQIISEISMKNWL